ncbi:6,7-dimethyl-8-ribityllumazine synthase [Dictyobacter arantiisoli]|uniref:6,7-dimethyl-8-ribityllumazine synthase n=1 Tax=Dictyobacter arantiisoli TaxID=2014874 RepID=A0A5A5TJC0_9CHLR|nr:6,7-dimethyl-8-ribityllumazine synthase [Dictyobacter arantiisoli]GCF11527.1 6,7-dimethyl-8-ribityllumazine synthase [Dictyobacter arantiisoli]
MQTQIQVMTRPEPDLDGTGLRIGLIVARWNWHITGALYKLAQEELLHLGVAQEDINVVYAPGSYELPVVAQAMAQTKNYDALICIGCVMKGATRHDVIVGDSAAQGIQRVALDTGVPIILGVQCAETPEQAEERIARGTEFAVAAVETVRTIQALRQQ